MFTKSMKSDRSKYNLEPKRTKAHDFEAHGFEAHDFGATEIVSQPTREVFPQK